MSLNFSTILTKIISILFLLIPFLPLELLFGEIKGFKWTMTPYIWVLSISILFFSSWLINSIIPEASNYFFNLIKNPINYFSKLLPKIWTLILLFELIFISKYAFSHKPLLIDEIVQVFQAEIFYSGRIKAILPKYPEFFVTQHMIFDQSGWFGQYPPGHSLVILTSLFFGFTWISSILLSICSIGIMVKFTDNIFGKKISTLTLFLCLICPFFLFMSASHMNHVSSFFLICLFMYSFERWETTNRKKYLFAASFFVGISTLIRPLDIIAVSIFLILPGIKKIKNNPTQIIFLVLGVIPGVFCNLYYNKITTGDFFTPGYIKLWGQAHGLGFHESPWGIKHTPLSGLRNELVDLQLLNEMLFEWPMPSLLALAIFLLFFKLEEKWPKRLLLIGVSLPLTYFFYWHRDAYLGPRFMYSGLIAWIPLTAYSISTLLTKFESIEIKLFGLFKSFQIKNFIYTLLFFSLIYSISYSFPERLNIYASSFASIKKDILSEAKSKGISSGIIFIKSSWGVRIISELRGKGVSASLTQKAYSNVDHCELYELLKNYEKENLSLDILKKNIEIKIAEKQNILITKINFDPSLKLDPKKILSTSCKEELKYDVKDDKQDFTVYEPHMRANKPDFSGNFIVAKDLRDKNKLLLEQYPNFKAYIYNGTEFKELNS